MPTSAKKAKPKPEVGEKPLKLQDHMVLALLNLKADTGPNGFSLTQGLPCKWQHRVPVVWPERKLIPFLDRAWSDPGGTALFGRGEYLQVPCLHPDDAPHRDNERTVRLRCPLGQQGDRLWVNEFIRAGKGRKSFLYRADGALVREKLHGMLRTMYSQPSFRAERWSARIWLEISRVRLQRAGSVTRKEARAEGMGSLADYVLHWDSLHGGAGRGWRTNCWMWVLELRRLRVD